MGSKKLKAIAVRASEGRAHRGGRQGRSQGHPEGLQPEIKNSRFHEGADRSRDRRRRPASCSPSGTVPPITGRPPAPTPCPRRTSSTRPTWTSTSSIPTAAMPARCAAARWSGSTRARSRARTRPTGPNTRPWPRWAPCAATTGQAIIRANEICNRYGIDTIGVGGAVAFAIECYEKRPHRQDRHRRAGAELGQLGSRRGPDRADRRPRGLRGACSPTVPSGGGEDRQGQRAVRHARGRPRDPAPRPAYDSGHGYASTSPMPQPASHWGRRRWRCSKAGARWAPTRC